MSSMAQQRRGRSSRRHSAGARAVDESDGEESLRAEGESPQRVTRSMAHRASMGHRASGAGQAAGIAGSDSLAARQRVDRPGGRPVPPVVSQPPSMQLNVWQVFHCHLPFASPGTADPFRDSPKEEVDVCLWVAKILGWLAATTIGLSIFFCVPLLLPAILVRSDWVCQIAETSFLRMLPKYTRTTGAVLGAVILPIALYHIKRLAYADPPVNPPLVDHRTLAGVLHKQSRGSDITMQFGNCFRYWFQPLLECVQYIFDQWSWRLLWTVVRVIGLCVLCAWQRNSAAIDPQTVMVPWHAPNVLARAGLYHGYQSLIGHRYTHSRLDVLPNSEFELAPLGKPSPDDFTLDFVADIGDGAAATHAVALLLAQPSLGSLRRGDAIIAGGDLVYPWPTLENYEKKTVRLYNEVLRCAANTTCTRPPMLLIAGNHEYLDGAFAFDEMLLHNCKHELCLGAGTLHFQGWNVSQTQRYWSAHVASQNVWIFGLDDQSALERRTIDQQQLHFFMQKLKSMRGADRLILVQHSPWFLLPHTTFDANFRTLMRAIQMSRRLRLVLCGDLHYYAHYVSADSQLHLVVAGNGGAFLHSTRNLNITLDQRSLAFELFHTTFTLQHSFPGKNDTRPYAWSVEWSINIGYIGLVLVVLVYTRTLAHVACGIMIAYLLISIYASAVEATCTLLFGALWVCTIYQLRFFNRLMQLAQWRIDLMAHTLYVFGRERRTARARAPPLDLDLCAQTFHSSIHHTEESSDNRVFDFSLYFQRPENDVHHVINHLQHAFVTLRSAVSESLLLMDALSDFALTTRAFAMSIKTALKVFVYNLQFGCASMVFLWWHVAYGLGLPDATKSSLEQCFQAVQKRWRAVEQDFEIGRKPSSWWTELCALVDAVLIAFVFYLIIKNAVLWTVFHYPVVLDIDLEDMVFSFLGASDFKGFVRLVLSADSLTAHAVCITSVGDYVSSEMEHVIDAFNLTVAQMPKRETHFVGETFTIPR